MSWFDSIFGYFGLPLMIALAGGIIFGLGTLVIGMIVWALMFLYGVLNSPEYKKHTKSDKKRSKATHETHCLCRLLPKWRHCERRV